MIYLFLFQRLNSLPTLKMFPQQNCLMKFLSVDCQQFTPFVRLFENYTENSNEMKEKNGRRVVTHVLCDLVSLQFDQSVSASLVCIILRLLVVVDSFFVHSLVQLIENARDFCAKKLHKIIVAHFRVFSPDTLSSRAEK